MLAALCPRSGWSSTCMRACHHGPAAVLKEVIGLLHRHPHVADLEKKVTYLCKREQQMQYPHSQALGWPLGSGSVESANNGVVQARLKGAGMRLPALACQSAAGVAPRCLCRAVGTRLARGMPAAPAR